MDSGSFKGIDAAIVKSYKDNIKKLREAEKELKVYNSPSKQQKEAPFSPPQEPAGRNRSYG